MNSRSRLPWPLYRERATQGKAVAGIVISGLIALLSLALLPFMTDDLTSLTIGTSMMVIFASAALLSYSLFVASWRRGRWTRIVALHNGEAGTLFARARVPSILFAIAGIGCIAIGGSYSALHLGPGRFESTVQELVMAVVAIPIYLFILAILLLPIFMHRRGRRLGIALTSSGVYVWRGSGCVFIAWDWIGAIRAEEQPFLFVLEGLDPDQRPMNPEENWFTRNTRLRRSFRRYSTAGHAVDPVAIYSALCFYHRHVERRSELGSSAAQQRIEDNDFPDITEEIKRYGWVRGRRELAT